MLKQNKNVKAQGIPLRFILVVGIMTGGCLGVGNKMSASTEGSDSVAPCTDVKKCCAKEDLYCAGNPDNAINCRCDSLWNCTENLQKCSQPLPTPNNVNGWQWMCNWTRDKYLCVATLKESPNQNGTIDSASSNVPQLKKGWNCEKTAESEAAFLQTIFGAAGEARWSCSKEIIPTPSNNSAGKDAWACAVKSSGTPGTTPSTSGTPDELSCARINNETLGVPGSPLLPTPTPDAGIAPSAQPLKGECVPGSKKWCDGLQYCGWGQVSCGANGYWERTYRGKLNCFEPSDQRRPATKCACYSTYYNQACCEDPTSCLIPAGQNGQICPPSPGRLCDYCNERASECVEGQCIVSKNNETFCGRNCRFDAECGVGYTCKRVKVHHQSLMQCYPNGGRCLNNDLK
jgi:hypothetical protein